MESQPARAKRPAMYSASQPHTPSPRSKPFERIHCESKGLLRRNYSPGAGETPYSPMRQRVKSGKREPGVSAASNRQSKLGDLFVYPLGLFGINWTDIGR